MQFEILPYTESLPAGKAEYLIRDYTLTYQHGHPSVIHDYDMMSTIEDVVNVRNDPVLIIAGQLTIESPPPLFTLRSFDMYTNKDKWTYDESIATPTPKMEGALKVIGAESDRLTIGEDVQCFFSEANRCLKLCIGLTASPLTFVRVSSCLIVGIGDRAIRRLYVEQLSQSE